MKVNAVHEGEPATVELEIEFDKGEYVEVVKTIPAAIAILRVKLNKKRKGK